MKKIPLLLLVALGASAAIVPSVALAAKGDPKMTKPTLISKYDANKNGKLDADELAQVKSDFLADPQGELKRLDADKDGKLDDKELATLSGKKEKPEGKKPRGKKKQADK